MLHAVMRPLALTLSVLVLASSLAGCFGAGDTEGPPAPGAGVPTNGTPTPEPPTATPPTGVPTGSDPPPEKRLEQAPWWGVGEYWNTVFTFPDGSTRAVKLVHFMNDSATEHFWLGVKDRNITMEHALYDTIPLLGRIHHYHMAPHEKGAHAVMYDFPIAEGKAWQTPLFGTTWNMVVTEASTGGWRVHGTDVDGTGKVIDYDYDPASRWFKALKIRNATATILDAKITGHGFGETGTFTFLRGRDFYRGPETRDATHEETFNVPADDPVDSLAFHANVATGGPLVIQLLGPDGNEVARHAITELTGGKLRSTIEIPDPAVGTYTVRYVTVTGFTGHVFGIGLQETNATL